MFAEIGLIQRISVFLGHPVHALGIRLFSIILSTGAGSLLSERLVPTRPGHFVLWLGLLSAYLLLLPLWLPELLHSSLAAATLPWRALVSVAVIFPAGLLMGFGFPTGMRLITRLDGRLTPWLWGQWRPRRARRRHRRRLQHRLLHRRHHQGGRRLLCPASALRPAAPAADPGKAMEGGRGLG